MRTRDPLGIPLEFYCRMERLPPIHQKYALYKGVKPLRIDHFNCFSPDVDASVAFYNEIGFRVTEYTADEESGRFWAAWMHRKGGVHDIAFTNGRGPRLHHTAFWVPTPLAIIDLLDLMATTGWVANIERGPGRHGISNAFFLYILDPDGHRIEIYCSDYQTVDPDLEPIKWDLKDPQRQTLRGARGAEVLVRARQPSSPASSRARPASTPSRSSRPDPWRAPCLPRRHRSLIDTAASPRSRSRADAATASSRERGFVDLSPAFGRRLAEPARGDRGRRAGAGSSRRRRPKPADRLRSRRCRFEIPVSAPEKIICVGVNFPDRNEEYSDGQAGPPTLRCSCALPRSFIGHGTPLIAPARVATSSTTRARSSIVIGKAGRRIAERDAPRSYRRGDAAPTKAPSATGCGTPSSTSPRARISTAPARSAPGWCPSWRKGRSPTSGLTTRVNGEVRQHDRTSRMTFGFRRLIAYISTFTTLVPGDIILTGTPTGAGARFEPPRWLVPGDVGRGRGRRHRPPHQRCDR